MNITPEQISFESKIIWLQPVETLPRYVRQSLATTCRRAARINWTEKVVGYAVLKPEAKGVSAGTFVRRIFWLMNHDPYTGGGAPGEAVDPRTVAPGEVGRMTDEAYGLAGSAVLR